MCGVYNAGEHGLEVFFSAPERIWPLTIALECKAYNSYLKLDLYDGSP